MSTFEWEPSWGEILEQQERILRYDSFTREQAMELGLKILELVKRRGWGSAAVRIVEDGTTVFAYKMPGTSLENDWWMDRKLAVAQYTGSSSLRAYVEAQLGKRTPFWEARQDNYATCGGCFPILPADGTHPWAYVLVSGLAHYHDHQVIADAMAWQLQKQVPSICG